MSNYKFILLGCFLSLSAPFDDKKPPKNIPPKESDYFEPSEEIKQSLIYRSVKRSQPNHEYFFLYEGNMCYMRKDGKMRFETPYERYMKGYDE